MALQLSLDTLDGVEPSLASLYSQGDDGKYHLGVEGVTEMQAALKAANREAAERRKALEKLKGVDPDDYARLKSLEEEQKLKQAEQRGEWEKLKEQMIAKHQEELKGAFTGQNILRQALETHLIDAQATAAIVTAKGVPQLLLPHVKTRVKVIEEDGQFKVQVLNERGEPMISDASGTPATISDLVNSFKSDPIYGRAFESSGASGGSAPPAASGTNQPDLTKLSPVERMKLARRN